MGGKGYFVHVPNKWEQTLHCKVVSHTGWAQTQNDPWGGGWDKAFTVRARFLSLAQSELGLCSANHRALSNFSNLACDWLSIVWAYSEQETENGPRCEREVVHDQGKQRPAIRSTAQNLELLLYYNIAATRLVKNDCIKQRQSHLSNIFYRVFGKYIVINSDYWTISDKFCPLRRFQLVSVSWAIIHFFKYKQIHGWPSTQPGSLHTALQRKYTQPCSLFSRGTAVWTMGARLCEQWGTAVCKCPAV